MPGWMFTSTAVTCAAVAALLLAACGDSGSDGGAAEAASAQAPAPPPATGEFAPLVAEIPTVPRVVVTHSDPVGTLYTVVLPSGEALAWAREKARPKRLVCHGDAAGEGLVCDSPDGTTHAFVDARGDGTSVVQVSLPPR